MISKQISSFDDPRGVRGRAATELHLATAKVIIDCDLLGRLSTATSATQLGQHIYLSSCAE